MIFLPFSSADMILSVSFCLSQKYSGETYPVSTNGLSGILLFLFMSSRILRHVLYVMQIYNFMITILQRMENDKLQLCFLPNKHLSRIQLYSADLRTLFIKTLFTNACTEEAQRGGLFRVGGQVPDSFLSWNCRRSAPSGYQCVPLGVLAKVMRNEE